MNEVAPKVAPLPLGPCLDSIEKNGLQNTNRKTLQKYRKLGPSLMGVKHMPHLVGSKSHKEILASSHVGHIPPPDRLRLEIHIQEEVHERLRTGKEKIKSRIMIP